MTHSTSIQTRVLRDSKTPTLKRWRLVTWLVEIGVKVDGLPTREHIKQAHRLFRGARGESVHVNNLWSKIKNHVCPVCDGVKLRDKYKTCSQVCGLLLRDGKVGGIAMFLLVSTLCSHAQRGTRAFVQPEPVVVSSITLPALAPVAKKTNYLTWNHIPGVTYRVQVGATRGNYTNTFTVTTNRFQLTNGLTYAVWSVQGAIESAAPGLWPSNAFYTKIVQTSTNLTTWKDAFVWTNNVTIPQEYLRIRTELTRWE